ncbi:MAG: hypothetical protein AAF968_03435 [Pseudomonadota bacterium]
MSDVENATKAPPRGGAPGDGCEVDFEGIALSEALKIVEAQYLVAVYEAANWDQKAAAERAGLCIDTFRRKFAALRPMLRLTFAGTPRRGSA